ncbi:hypothetical protein QQS21_010393 [Conoideocrella luteorostrata]|uniref:P-loop containing nucleoside triphosphate hydrolase protein n=1 Tax=Conoideocrella luteorostrata TaxID=1105319 RepID=A0AAJ0CHV5_9HYPO|nr:hypothetical protein QQS21_010393 [Conoideocrella luteorostrata]
MAQGRLIRDDWALGSVEEIDFTLLSSLPAAFFVVAFPFRLGHLTKSGPKTRIGPLRVWKFAAAIVLLVLQVALLLFRSRLGIDHTKTWLPSAIIHAVASAQLVILSWAEDARSIRPSSMLSSYLIVTLILNIADCWTLWLRRIDDTLPVISAAFIVVKLVMLFLESLSKTSYLYDTDDLSPEATSGLLNRSFLWWMNSLFRQGLRSTLTLDDLYPLDKHLASEALGIKIREAWAHRREPIRRFEFPLAAWRALRWHILSAVLLRLSLIAFTFAQPFLIAQVLGLLTQSNTNANRYAGYTLVMVAAFIYSGKAFSTLHYQHCVDRFMTMFRGAAVSLIYNHMLTLSLSDCDDSSVITLMSTDVDEIVNCLSGLNEVWAHLIEVVLGVVLLSRQLGWVCIIPLVVVVASFLGTAEIARTIGARQKVWVDAIQRRINVTASMLSEMRSVKMMGLSQVLYRIVQDQRVQETRRMSGARWSIVWQNVVQNLPWTLAPALTFVIYVAQAASRGQAAIDVTQAFTSLSVITLLTDPVAKLLSAIPSTAASIGCFDRIQDFLALSPRNDPRIVSSFVRPRSGFRSNDYAIHARGLVLRPAPVADPIATDVNFAVPRGSLVMVVGPVGSGKTTLLKAILGEVTQEHGSSLTVAGIHIAYCAQVPWLPNTSIRQAISGYVDDGSGLEESWYEQCLHACALDHDLTHLSDGDGTLVGSASTVLSGGQRARVALARAVYSRADTILLDDVLGALDTNTQATIMSRLFGEAGLLRKLQTTVVLVTHATDYLKYADKTLIIANGRVEECGRGEEALSDESIDVLHLRDRSKPESENQEQGRDLTAKADLVSEMNEKNDLNNSRGDLGVYFYYFKSVGWLNMALFVSFVVIDVFCSSFTSKWLILFRLCEPAAADHRKASGSSGGPRFMEVILLFI